MKVNGITLNSMRVAKVYLPVADDQVVEFVFRPLRSDENFTDVMPMPVPPEVITPQKGKFRNTEDPTYKKAIEEWASSKLDWEFLKSISATEGLEWETVDLSKPETWKNWRTDFEKVFGIGEINKIFQGFIDIQYITEETMEKARKRFLTGRLEQVE